MLRSSATRYRVLTAAILIVGAVLRLDGIWRGVDQPSWRECDVAAIARAYNRGSLLDFAYPQIDWRGDGPGYAEMELPLLSWLMAVGYRLWGEQEQIGRIWAYLFALAGLSGSALLLHKLLPRTAATVALLVICVAPLPLRLATALQPDRLMLTFCVCSAYAFACWLERPHSPWRILATGGLTALAIMAKAPAAHLGLLYAGWLLSVHGFKALRDPAVWIVGLVSVAPAVAWYLHARSLWHAYGNSLGVSNESHWVGADLFHDSTFILGILRNEWEAVWLPGGAALGLVALVYVPACRAKRVALGWTVACWCFFLAAARSTSEAFFDYYHVIAVPAAAMIQGLALMWSLDALRDVPRTGRGALTFLGASLTGLALALGFTSTALGAALGTLGIWVWMTFRAAGSTARFRWAHVVAATAVMATVASPLAELGRWRHVRPSEPSPLFLDARQLAADIPEDVLIVAHGEQSTDRQGLPVAYQASYVFYWLDRRGFSLAREKQSVAELERLVSRGARYFVAERKALALKPGLEDELAARFRLLRKTETLSLYALSSSSR